MKNVLKIISIFIIAVFCLFILPFWIALLGQSMLCNFGYGEVPILEYPLFDIIDWVLCAIFGGMLSFAICEL